jgi:hypothetical protein
MAGYLAGNFFICYCPNIMSLAIEAAGAYYRLPGRLPFQYPGNLLAGVLIHGEYRAGIGLERPEQVETVATRPGERAFVGADHPRFPFFKSDTGDDTATPVSSFLELEVMVMDVDSGRFVYEDDAPAEPLF